METKPKARPLTLEEIEDYLSRKGTVCPFCKSDDIEGEDFSVDMNDGRLEVRCNVCNRYWHDVYRLVHVVALDEQGSEIETVIIRVKITD
jgi:formate dehydrogenase maturation protein FdhE